MQSIVLASGSPYRAELLRKLHLNFVTCSSQVNETPLPNESVDNLVQRLSFDKAHALSSTYPRHLIIGSDQAASCNGKLINKPENREAAIQQLQEQSGQCVKFYTGVGVLNSSTGHYFYDVDVCSVYFRELSLRQIEHYIDIEQPFDCAGSFKSEQLGISLFTKIISDDPNTLIGLPLIKLIDLLAKHSVSILYS